MRITDSDIIALRRYIKDLAPIAKEDKALKNQAERICDRIRPLVNCVKKTRKGQETYDAKIFAKNAKTIEQLLFEYKRFCEKRIPISKDKEAVEDKIRNLFKGVSVGHMSSKLSSIDLTDREVSALEEVFPYLMLYVPLNPTLRAKKEKRIINICVKFLEETEFSRLRIRMISGLEDNEIEGIAANTRFYPELTQNFCIKSIARLTKYEDIEALQEIGGK